MQLVQQELLILTGLGVTGKDDGAAISGGELDIEHLHGRHFGEYLGRGKPRGDLAQATFQGDPQTVGQEADKDMGFDAIIVLVVDGPD